MEIIEKRIDEEDGQVWWGCNYCSALHEDEAIMRRHADSHKMGPELSDEELDDLLAELGRIDDKVAEEEAAAVSYRSTCGDCGVEWYPGHTCIVARPPSAEIEALVRSVRPAPDDYEPTEQERAELEQEAYDMETLERYEALLGRLATQRQISGQAWLESIEVLSLAKVARQYGEPGRPEDILPDHMRISHLVNHPDDWEAL